MKRKRVDDRLEAPDTATFPITDLPTLKKVIGCSGVWSVDHDHQALAIFGSVDFYHAQSEAICQAIGRLLAQQFPRLTLVTGANAIVHDVIARTFYEEVLRQQSAKNRDDDNAHPPKHRETPPRIFHLTPQGSDCSWNYGRVLLVGRNFEERRELLATCPSVALSVEGGPGTADELRKAAAHKIPLVPVGRSGGASSGMFEAPCQRKSRPDFITTTDWHRIWDSEATTVEATAAAVVRSIEVALQRKKKAQPPEEYL